MRQLVNEYLTPILATVAFPSLFSDGKGDPTNPSLYQDILVGERIKQKRMMAHGFTALPHTLNLLTGLVI